MKGSLEVVEKALDGYEGDWELHHDGIRNKRSLWEWRKPFVQDARLVGCGLASIVAVIWAFMISSNDYILDSPNALPILAIFVIAVLIMPPIFGIFMTIPVIHDKRRYHTTNEHACYWRQNKQLREHAPDNLSTDEFTLIIEAAQRADRTAFELICISRMADSIETWKADAKLPTVPEEELFLEALRTAVRENADRPIT